MPIKREHRWNLVFVAPGFLGLVAVLGAIWAGFSPHRLWPVAGFLILWVGSASYVGLANKASRQRTFRLQLAPVPKGKRLRKPLWLALEVPAMGLVATGIFGAIAAALGFPGVGLGIALTAVGMYGFVGATMSFLLSPDLMFDDGGLRLYLRSTQCLVPWTSIQNVEAIGPRGFQIIRLRITEPERVIASVVPDSPRHRTRAQRLLGKPGARESEVLLNRWTAGLDGESLVRAIRDGMARRPAQVS